MTDYTPSTDVIRECYVRTVLRNGGTVRQAEDAFTRWLEATERTLRRLDQATLHQALTAILSGGTDYQAGTTR